MSRDAGPVKGGDSIIAFVDDPTGYKWEIIGSKGKPIPEPIAQACCSRTFPAIRMSICWCINISGLALHRGADPVLCRVNRCLTHPACLQHDDWLTAALRSAWLSWSCGIPGHSLRTTAQGNSLRAPAEKLPETLAGSNMPERMLQVMLRVTDLDKSIKYYTEALGMQLVKKKDNPEYKYTLAFLAYGPEEDNVVFELTHNW